MRRRPVLAAVNWMMAALFAVAAAVQLNDPDPAAWVAVYAAAAIGCVSFGRVPHVWLGHAGLALFALAWSAALLSGLSGPVDADSVFDMGMKMRGDATEGVREAAGLALVAAWMALLAGFGFRAR